MIASLPMYLRASNRASHDELWGLIRDGLRERGVDAPEGLDHQIDHMVGWAREDLVLSQICNLPYRTKFKGAVTLIGAADYGLDGCAAGYYRSVFVAHTEATAKTPQALAQGRFVCNDLLSQSGYGAPQLWAAAQGFQFSQPTETGSHRASIAAVAEGHADIAAIDAQTWRIEAGNNPTTSQLKIIGYTSTTPGQTFVTRKGQDPAPYFAAITEAIAMLSEESASVLGLKGIVALPKAAYELPLPPSLAEIHA